MRALAVPFAMTILAAAVWPLPAAAQEGVAPKGPLNSLHDVTEALRKCWKWPPYSEIRV